MVGIKGHVKKDLHLIKGHSFTQDAVIKAWKVLRVEKYCLKLVSMEMVVENLMKSI